MNELLAGHASYSSTEAILAERQTARVTGNAEESSITITVTVSWSFTFTWTV